MPEPEKPERVPPETETSLELKSVDTSLSVKEIVELSLDFNKDLLLVMMIEGCTFSIVKGWLKFAEVFISTLNVLSVSFAVIMSILLSWLISPRATDLGLLPIA